MTITNKKQTIFLRRIFFLVSLTLALGALASFLLDFSVAGFSLAGVFALWFLYFQFADYQYIEFISTNSKIALRYYKAIGLGRTSYNAIEFPQQLLHKFHFENSIFGKMTDLTLVIKTRRGIAEYPSVSLTALPVADRKKLQEALFKILEV